MTYLLAVKTTLVSYFIPSAGMGLRIPPRRARELHRLTLLPWVSTQTTWTTTHSTRHLPCFAPRTRIGRSTGGDATWSSVAAALQTSWTPSKMQIHYCLYFPSPTITTGIFFTAHSPRGLLPAIRTAVAVRTTRCSYGYTHDRH